MARGVENEKEDRNRKLEREMGTEICAKKWKGGDNAELRNKGRDDSELGNKGGDDSELRNKGRDDSELGNKGGDDAKQSQP